MSHCSSKTFSCRFFYGHCIKLSFVIYPCSVILLIKWQMIYSFAIIYVTFYHCVVTNRDF